MSDTLEDQVKRFVAQAFAARPDRLSASTRLQHDLGVDGADGWEFVEAFGRQFGVDISEFRSDLHFGPEAGCNPVVYVFLLVFRPRSLRFVPVTVGDLVEAARSKRWRTPARGPA